MSTAAHDSPRLAPRAELDPPRGGWTTTTVLWFIFILGCTAFVSFYHLYGGEPFGPTDAWVAQTTREMIDRGDWIVPHFAGEPFLQKSPGPYCAVALVTWIRGTGVDEVSTRVPNAVAGVILVGTILWLTRRIAGDRVAIFAGAAAASSVFILYWTHRANAELGVACCIAVSLACFWIGVSDGPGWRRTVLWGVGYFAAGVGMLYKLPMPIACVGAPLYAYVLYRAALLPLSNRRRDLAVGGALTVATIGVALACGLSLKLSVVAGALALGTLAAIRLLASSARPWTTLLAHAIGLIAFLLPWLPWVILLCRREPMALEKWRVEFLDRFTGELPNVEEHKIWYFYFLYLIPPLLFCLPYSLSLPAAIVRGLRRDARYDHDGMMFMLIWFFSLLAFFTASTGKEVRYFLPAIPPLFVLLGCELADLFDSKRTGRARRERLLALAAWGIVVAALVGGFFGLKAWHARYELCDWSDLWRAYVVLAAVLALGVGLTAWLVGRGRRGAAFAALVGTMWVLWAWIWPNFLPLMSSQAPSLDFASQLKNDLPFEYRSRLRNVGFHDPRIIWLTDIRYPRVFDQLKLLDMQEGRRSLAFERRVIGEEMVRQLERPELVLLVATRPDYILFLVEARQELAEVGREMPRTHLWMQTRVGPKHAHIIVFGNQPPPWPEPPLTPPSERLEVE